MKTKFTYRINESHLLLAAMVVCFQLNLLAQPNMNPVYPAGFDKAKVQQEIDEAIKKGVPASELEYYMQSAIEAYNFQQSQKGVVKKTTAPTFNISASSCNNPDFETGDFTGWTGYTGCAPQAYLYPGNIAGMCGCANNTGCMSPGIVAGQHTIVSGAGTDFYGGFPVVAPGGNYSVKLGNSQVAGHSERITSTFTVDATSTGYSYQYAVVLQDPGHVMAEQPFFKIAMMAQNGDTIPCSYYFVAAGQGIPGFSTSTADASVIYKPWTTVIIDLTAYVGKTLTIEFTTADCARGGHFGYAYIDSKCMQYKVTQTIPLCTGSNTNLVAPTGAASYSWTGPNGYTAVTQTISASQSGNYSVELTSVQGCKTVLNYLLTTSSPTPNFTPTVVCQGSSNAFSDLSVPAAGTTITGWSWNFGDGTTSTLQNPNHSYIASGTYTTTLTLTSSDGCIMPVSKQVVVNPLPTIAFNPNNVSCFGLNDGTLSSTITTATSPYTYSWSTAPVQTTANATGLYSGTYSLKVTDTKGCSSISNGTITQPAVLATVPASTNVTCNGGSNGTAGVTASGGTTAYSYSWSTVPSKTTASVTGLTATDYTVKTTDAKGCTKVNTFTLTQPTTITAAHTSSSVSCNAGTNGTASVSASGGISPYTYVWNSTPAQTVSAVTGLAAGNYTVTITDNVGCTATNTVVITQPTALIAGAVSTPVSCNGGNEGTATVNAAGGISGYTYSWSNATTSATVSGLKQGTYTVTVKDANNCSKTTTALVTEPAVLTLAATSTTITCNGGTNAAITATPAGGNSPYNYSWSYSAAQTASSATSLSAGGYTISVTDNKGCTGSTSIAITQPTAILTFITGSTSVSCFAGKDGTAGAQAGGGTPPLVYSWNTSPTQNALNASALSAGGYTLTVTDANGCTGTTKVSITQPPALTTLLEHAISASCNQNKNGNALVTASGGTTPYNYSWNTSPSQTTAFATGIGAGSYTNTVTDSKGCTTTISATITQPPVLTFALGSKVDMKCYGDNAGYAVFTPGGGTSPYAYSWNTTPPKTTPSATELVPGTYVVKITDSKGCTSTASVTITQPDSLYASICISCTKNVSCFGGKDGSAKINASGATAPYKYAWSTTPVQTTNTVTGLGKGSYTVQVTDANNCFKKHVVTITEPPALSLATQVSNVSCKGLKDGLGIAISGGGTPPYSYKWNLGTNAASLTSNASGLAAGSYTIAIGDAMGCTLSSSISVIEPAVLTTTVSNISNVTCNGLNNGFAVASPVGGTTPYNFSWNTFPAQTVVSASGLAAGEYLVKVTDNKGCTAVSSLMITQPANLYAATSNVKDISCNNGNDGAITTSVTGGTSPYSYSWSNDPTLKTNFAGSLKAGKYTVKVADASLCLTVLNHTLTEPNPVTLSVSGADTVCSGTTTAMKAIAGGGVGNYSYSWSTGSSGSSQTIKPTVSTTYTVQVTDGHGCSSGPKVIPVVVPQPGTVDISINGVKDICEGGSLALSATTTAIPSSSKVTWSDGLGTGLGPFTVNPKGTTSYTVTVTDVCSNTSTKSATVKVNKNPVIQIPPKTATGCDAVDLSFADTSSANQGSSYLWNFGDGFTSTQTSPAHNYTQSGTFNIEVKLKSPVGCDGKTTTTYVTVINPSPVAGFDAELASASIYTPTIKFTNTSLNATTSEWDFGDGIQSKDVSPSHVYKSIGTYNVKLKVYNLNVCVDSIIKPVEIKPEFQFFVPNAFTPDGDGKNDTFNGKGEEIVTYRMMIFDRWGDMVFESNDYNKAWDGRANGGTDIAQQDVYVYKIKLTDFRGNVHDYIGHVSLVK